ncbi:MAG: peptidyl-tRNA hydrolase [Alphaproteobacteria bacterium]|nr:peptidyl-tRNA hydrolase [Alphaproteobacteria bacterium]
MVLFVGPMATQIRPGTMPGVEGRLHRIISRRSARVFLAQHSRSGDLVLVKASHPADDFQDFADIELAPPSDDGDRVGHAPEDETRSRAFGIVGLGNPTEAPADTPHNLGHRVVDELVRELDASPWQDRGKFRLAETKVGDVTVHLIKTTTMMNISGPAVAEALDALHLDSQRCILVHDDAMSDLGSVRNRDRVGDGGHRGVRSVLQALGNDEILRLKIDILTTRRDGRTAEQFLTPFPDDEKDTVSRACATARARARALELIRTRS